MSYVNFHSINHIERCGNTTSPPPSHPPGALNINKLFRKWALGKEIAEIQTKRFPLSLRNWHLTKKKPTQKQTHKPKKLQTPPSPLSHPFSPPQKSKPPPPTKKKRVVQFDLQIVVELLLSLPTTLVWISPPKPMLSHLLWNWKWGVWDRALDFFF